MHPTDNLPHTRASLTCMPSDKYSTIRMDEEDEPQMGERELLRQVQPGLDRLLWESHG